MDPEVKCVICFTWPPAKIANDHMFGVPLRRSEIATETLPGNQAATRASSSKVFGTASSASRSPVAAETTKSVLASSSLPLRINLSISSGRPEIWCLSVTPSRYSMAMKL
jgi:hypothetical protein